MKILWFVNTPFPEMLNHMGLKGDFMGCWMPALKQALISLPGFQSGSEYQLGIACALSGFTEYQRFQTDNVIYFCLPKTRICEYIQSYRRELSYCIKAVKDFDPDILHVHGTEEFYGIISECISQPVVISIQGILSAYVRVFFGGMRCSDILRSPRIIKQYLTMCRKTKTEQRIFRINRYFIGRTIWDQGHLSGLGPDQYAYYHCDEVMREAFYENAWCIEESEAKSIACISSPYPYKGIDSILEAMTYLKRMVPEVMLHIYGSFSLNGYGAFLREKTKTLGLSDHVRFCGFKNSDELAAALKKARAFVIASHIENSANSLQEAMLVGTPAVVSFAGGLSSIAEHEKSCLMFPRGDPAVMAECLYRVLSDDELAVKISEESRKKSRKMNSPERVAKQLIGIYRDVIDQGRQHP
ncbi:MAG: glycosyltransferase family 4 protein [bacterium]